MDTSAGWRPRRPHHPALAALAYDVILVETVGVGQSEVEIAGAADTTVVLLAPGMGDGIQAAKAGIPEIADVFAVNKSDLPGSHRTVREIRQALNLTVRADDTGPGRRSCRSVPSTARGIAGADRGDRRAPGSERRHGELAAQRARRARAEIEALVLRALGERLAPQITTSAADVAAGRMDPHTAAHAIAEAIPGAPPLTWRMAAFCHACGARPALHRYSDAGRQPPQGEPNTAILARRRGPATARPA